MVDNLNGGILDRINAAGYANQVIRPEDYYKDGVLYCGRCNTPKEKIVEAFGSKRKFAIRCTCADIEYEREKKEQLEAERRLRLSRLKTASLLDVKYHDANLDNFIHRAENEMLYKLCKSYIEDFWSYAERNQGILLYGDVGTGKSYAAACIANGLLERGISVTMTSFVKILEAIRKGADAEAEILRQIEQSALVVFDDFGVERTTDYALEKVYDVIDARYRSKKPMIVTTNVQLRDMARETDMRYRRIYDRIFETCYPLEVTGKSFRRIAANDRYAQMKKVLEG